MTLRTTALALLAETDPTAKASGVRALAAAAPPLDTQADLQHAAAALALPGRPARPRLVAPARLPQRPVGTPAGRAALLHAIAHIEFNAIHLALDACWRFAGQPAAYYRQWLAVAGEEALHFQLVRAHLNTLGHDYGDFDAHDGLWQMAQDTRHDFVARMALVPRTLEARGLDATPPLQAKLRRAGDLRAVEILDIILRDEVGHVAVGNHWYRQACAQRGLDPLAHYAQLCQRYAAPPPRPPLNTAARRSAGFSDAELAWLQQQVHTIAPRPTP